MRRTIILPAVLLVALTAAASERHTSYVLVMGRHTSMEVRGWESESIGGLKARFGDRFFWFRDDDGRAYVVQDQAAVSEIEELMRPQREIGREQSALGRKQSELGRQQSALGRKQSEIGRQQSRLDGDSDRARMRELDDRMRDLDDQMRALDRKMRELDDQMRVKDDAMRAADREVERRLRSMMRDWTARGIARRAD
jgi:hypothetical protein